MPTDTTNPLPKRLTISKNIGPVVKRHQGIAVTDWCVEAGLAFTLAIAVRGDVKETRPMIEELARRFNAFGDLAEPNNVLITTPEKWKALNDKNAALVVALESVRWNVLGTEPNAWRVCRACGMAEPRGCRTDCAIRDAETA